MPYLLLKLLVELAIAQPYYRVPGSSLVITFCIGSTSGIRGCSNFSLFHSNGTLNLEQWSGGAPVLIGGPVVLVIEAVVATFGALFQHLSLCVVLPALVQQV